MALRQPLLFGVLAFASAFSFVRGYHLATVTTTIITVSAADDSHTGLLSFQDRSFIRKTWDQASDSLWPQKKLSAHQIRDVQRSWKNIRSGRNAMVSSIMIKLFKENPRSQKYFAKFANVPVDSLSDDAEFKKQIALVADRLDTIILAMDDERELLGYINYMRYTHAARNIHPRVWEDFGRILMESLAAGGVSSDDLNSWKEVLDVFVTGIAPKN